ncbi:hypothetical protein DH2020_049548 [Rehmannia glutinosa]|uniref:ACT domain-containing protein n=1 Tax=Rehmannia glutinosa TaxID=99300 RepID=A0ABR0U2J9_REHGL
MTKSLELLLDEAVEEAKLPKGDSWSIHKFGGTCVGTSERIQNVANIVVKDESKRKLVVVSAMSKVTDMMYDLIHKAQARDDSYITALDAVLEKHKSTALDLLEGDDLTNFLARLHEDINNLKAMLRAIYIAGHVTESFSDFVVGHGEIWSAQLLSAVVRKSGVECTWMDTREVLIVNPTSSNQVDPDYLESGRRLEKWYAKNSVDTIVATGFIASTPQNIPTTLKRDGSDFSAAIMGALFKAISEAVILEKLSYQEAWEMVILFKNIFNLSAPGTKICRPAGFENEDSYQMESPVKGFATIDNLALVNVEGTGMAGVPGTASAIFGAVKDVGANVIMISQALDAGRLSQIAVIPNCSILAAVGQKMASTPGVSATLFNALAKANINIRAIAQGCSEYNVTVVLKREDCIKALRAAAALKEKFNIDLRVMGITGSRTMLLSDMGIDLSTWRDIQKEKGEKADMQKFVQHVHGNHFIPNTVIVDCTADSHVASHYHDWLRRGIHVITPNKKANSGPLEQYLKLRTLQRQSYTHYFYEATVGAGLPIISTLQGLLETGDKISRIEGIFSGTLSYIFNNFVDDRTFSEVVKGAKEAGYTEPDPRDDLSGTDVARKVIILARESGLKLELSDIPVQSLVPDPLKDCVSADEFMQQLPQYDQDLAKQRQEAEATGEVLRYVGVVDVANQKGTVELRKYKKEHPFAQLSGSDNIIAFSTQRYEKQPLIVRGPGAGAEVTAGGVFSDILRLASYLGAPS